MVEGEDVGIDAVPGGGKKEEGRLKREDVRSGELVSGMPRCVLLLRLYLAKPFEFGTSFQPPGHLAGCDVIIHPFPCTLMPTNTRILVAHHLLPLGYYVRVRSTLRFTASSNTEKVERKASSLKCSSRHYFRILLHT